MSAAERMEQVMLTVADTVYRSLPQARPSRQRLQDCRLISHRGEHDNRAVFENTIPAFQKALEGGIWGVEFDVRWTKDLQPVVFHDEDGRRLFGFEGSVRHWRRTALKAACPMIPSLEEVLERFGGRLHLMVELKAEPTVAPQEQNLMLSRVFSTLVPQRDYHLISLSPAIFRNYTSFPSGVFLPIARLNVSAVCRLAEKRAYGGVLGHYLMMRRRFVRHQLETGRLVGTGFVDYRNCLFRELNRGVTWLFSNRAVAMQRIVGPSGRYDNERYDNELMETASRSSTVG